MNFFDSKRNLAVVGGLLGLVAASLAYFGNPANMAICVACFIRDTAGALKLHSATAVQYARPEIIGIVVGALIISISTKEYRSSGGSSPMIRFLLGMMIVIGSLIFLGCPLRMVIRMSAGDVNAYIALVGFIGGVGTGALALKSRFSLGRSYETTKESGLVLPLIMVVLLIISIFTTLLAVSKTGPGSLYAPLAISLIGGILFGILAQKSRMCFAGSVRDVILLKNFNLISIIGGFFIIMLTYNIVSGDFNFALKGQPIAHTEALWNILGMYVVGFAAVLAGGCPLRQLVLAGQGSNDAAITVIGMLAGAAISHNFNLASTIAGTTLPGRIVTLICIFLLFIIGFFMKRKA